MSGRLLKHRFNGAIFGWSPGLAKHADLYEVTEEQAYPENFMPEAVKVARDRLFLDIGDLDEGEPPPEAYTDTFMEIDDAEFTRAVADRGETVRHRWPVDPSVAPSDWSQEVGLTPPSPQVAA